MRSIVKVRHVLSFLVFVQSNVALAVTAVAQSQPAGVVVDYQPRTTAAGMPAIHIKRGANLYPVREHEVIYDGDEFVFTTGGGSEPFVTALIDAKTQIKLNPNNPTMPKHSWPDLQKVLPKLVAAYRWINSGRSSEGGVPRSAVSRGLVEDAMPPIAVLPRYGGKLLISDDGRRPLWLGWSGGTPPFKVRATNAGKVVAELQVCPGPADAACTREALLPGLGNGAEPIELMVKDANELSWSATVARAAVEADGGEADTASLGELGSFLHATELLDRGRGEYVLESARELAAISHRYPAARALLDQIRDGQIP